MRLLPKRLSTFALVLFGFAAGCDRSSTPPAPLAAAEFSAAFDKAFSKAKPEAKDLSSQLVAAVQAQDYSKAFAGLQSLAVREDLNKDQVSIITRALITVNGPSKIVRLTTSVRAMCGPCAVPRGAKKNAPVE